MDMYDEWKQQYNAWKTSLPKPKVATTSIKPLEFLPAPIGATPVVGEINAKLHRIFLGVGHEDIAEAVLADIVDFIPFVGDACNVARLAEAASLGGKYKKKRLLAQTIDAAGGALPEPISIIFDFLTPTNLILFINEEVDKRGWPKIPLPGGEG